MSKTPLPWSAKIEETVTLRDSADNKLAIFTHMHTKTGGRRDSTEVAANAAFIVRACNSHNALASALEGALNRLGQANKFIACEDEIGKCVAALAAAKELKS